MAKQPIGVWGIDLGQCGLKAIRLTEHEGTVTATAFDFVEHPKILSQPDADPDQLTREALEKFLSRNQLRGDVVAISVPGQSGLARFVKLPPVEEKKIGDIVRFEAKQQIPFNLDEVVWDYQKLGSGLVTDGFAMETEIGLFAMKRDAVNRYLQHFKDVHVDVHLVQMAPLALCNFVAYDLLKKGPTPDAEGDRGKKTAVVALDIGTDASNLVVTDGGRIIWQRPIPLGGNHFTRALTKDMKLTFAKAEHLKRNAIKSHDLKKILASIKPVLNDFVGEVQRSLGYFQNTHRDVAVEYMVGLGNAFRLPGLQRYLAEKLSLDVRKLEKMERLGGDGVVAAPSFTENILSFAVAYGLAIQGLKQSRLLTNLLPQEIRTERLIKAKKPWAVAAAAALLLAVGGMTYGYGRELWAYGGTANAGGGTAAKGAKPAAAAPGNADKNPVIEAQNKAKAVLDNIRRADVAFEEARKKAKEEEDAIGSIVAGQKEQINFLELSKFVDSVVPRPEDAANREFQAFLTGKATTADEKKAQRIRVGWLQEGYDALGPWYSWRAGKATTAAAKKPAGGEQPDELGPGIDRLIQFNIEALDCRYTTNLKAYWAKIDTEVKDKDNRIRPPEDAKAPPGENDKGWVVELRGYTFHEGLDNFVIDALLERIAQVGKIRTPPWPLTLKEEPKAPEAPKAGQPAPAGKPGEPAGDAAPPVGRPISHVVLYKVVNRPANDASNFEIIKTSYLDALVAGGGGGGARTTPQGDIAPKGPASGGAVAPKAPPVAPGIGGLTGRPGGAGAEGWEPLAGGTVLGGAATEAKTTEPRHKRTEFVILFIWREPAPSDDLLTKKPQASTEENPSGGPGGPGGSQGMGSQPPPGMGGAPK